MNAALIACLASQDPDLAGRESQLHDARRSYRWDHRYLSPVPLMHEEGEDLPGAFRAAFGWSWELPEQEWPDFRYWLQRMTLMKLGPRSKAWYRRWKHRNAIRGGDLPFESLDEWVRFYSGLWNPPWVLGSWHLDREFAWQRVAGPNPMVLRRARPGDSALPDRSAAGDHLPLVLRLERLAAEGELFVCDYDILTDLPTGSFAGARKALPTPRGFFHADLAGRLRALAIELAGGPCRPRLVAPEDGEEWMFARTCLQSADMNHHQLVIHLGRTHLALETVVVATRRQLPTRHPLSVLLRPHLRLVVWNNFEGRQLLLGPDGAASAILAGGAEGCEELLRRAWSGYPARDCPAFELGLWDHPEEIAARGIDDPRVLPEHPFRDDGALLWQALADYVLEYLRLYYPDDAHVARDPELAAWLEELRSPSGGRMRGVPERLETVEALARAATRILWASGPLHAAVNYLQYQVMGCVPNMPGALYLDDGGDPPGASLENLSGHARLLRMLPRRQTVLRQIFVMEVLTRCRYDRLGHYLARDFRDPRALEVIARFRTRLAEIEEILQVRDAARRRHESPYPVFFPSNVPNSASI